MDRERAIEFIDQFKRHWVINLAHIVYALEDPLKDTGNRYRLKLVTGEEIMLDSNTFLLIKARLVKKSDFRGIS